MSAYIVSAVRTAGGRRKGALAGVHPADLGGLVLDSVVDRAGIEPSLVEDVIFGCVTKAGEQSFTIGRSSVLASKLLPQSTPAVTIDRQCGSSQQAVQFAAQAIMSGTQDIVIAGGVESMTRVPMGSDYTLHAKAGIGMGPWSQGILDKYGVKQFSQFQGAQMVAEKYGIGREEMDRFAMLSHQRAAQAIKDGAFNDEIVAVPTELGQHLQDEGVRFEAALDDMANLEPIIEGNFITAGNASQMCDGASAVLLVSETALKEYGLKPLAKVHSFAVTAGDPVIMLDEPIAATVKVLDKAGLTLNDIDLFEVNEAFASIPLAWQKALKVDLDRLNVNGGAIALGHPLGASGTKLMTTLIYALKARGKRFGLQVMCEGGGLANATIIELI